MDHTPGTGRSRRVVAQLAIVLCLAVAVVAIPALAFGLPVTTCNPAATYSNIAASISITATTGADPTSYVGTRYWFDAAAPATVTAYPTTATVSIGTLGAHTINYFSIDASGGVETTKTKSFSILDTLKPVTWSDRSVNYLNSATITLTATDSVPGAAVWSGVAATRYQLDGGVVTTGTTVAASTVGDHVLKFWSTDVSGNWETTQTVSFTIVDTLKPVTLSDVSAGYLNSAAIHLTASDSASGVAATYWKLDSGDWTSGLAINVATYGNHSLSFYSVDGAGNTETAQTVTFFVDDSIAPVTSSDAVAAYTGSASITLTAVDTNGSGVTSTFYKVDGGAFVAGTSVTVSTLGSHTLSFYSVDAEHNTETVKSVNFTISAPAGADTTAPSTISNAVATYSTSPATIHLSCSELAGSSGIAQLCYKVDGGATEIVNPPAGIKAAAPPITPTVSAPAGHYTMPCTTCHTVTAAPDISSTAVAPAGHADLACTTCHTVTTAGGGGGGTTGTPVPCLALGCDVVVSGSGAHSIEFWGVDGAGNVETHHVVNFAITPAVTPVATSITIVRSAASVTRPKTFTLSGVLTPGVIGDPCVVHVKKPGSARWSYSSARLAYATSGTGALWWYRYAASLRGTYTFYVSFAGDATRLASQSGLVTVSVR